MTDLFGTGIQIPDLESGQARPADTPGFIRVFSRNQKLYGIDSNNVEHELSGAAGGNTNFLVDGGAAATTFQNYLLRFDFGNGGANINPTGTI